MKRWSLSTLGAVAALTIVCPLASCADSSSAPWDWGSSARDGDTAPISQFSAVERLRPEIVAVHPFDTGSFTEGLEVAPDGSLVVGTGHWGESRIYRRGIADATESQSVALPAEQFGEGITLTSDAAWQLTYKAGVAYRRDPNTFAETGQFHFDGEGWGLCAINDDELVMSNGSSELRVVSAADFSELRRITVTQGGHSVQRINELECTDEGIWANVFTTTRILRIDPSSGEVTAVVDASTLPNRARRNSNNVLNGIAHIPGTDRYLLAGKRWPDLYEVRFVS